MPPSEPDVLVLGNLGQSFRGVSPGDTFTLRAIVPIGDGWGHDCWSDGCGCAPAVSQDEAGDWLIEHQGFATPPEWELRETSVHVLGRGNEEGT